MRETLQESLVSLAVVLNWSVFSPERYHSPLNAVGLELTRGYFLS